MQYALNNIGLSLIIRRGLSPCVLFTSRLLSSFRTSRAFPTNVFACKIYISSLERKPKLSFYKNVLQPSL